jgi:hypothetical protein
MSIQNLYPNVKPSLLLDFANTKQLDPRITFTRASTGTYYDGKTVAKAEENLLLYSQDFTKNAPWTPFGNATVLSTKFIAPDGTTTANALNFPTGGSSNGVRYYYTLTAGVAYTFSLYVRSQSGGTGFSLDIQNALTQGLTLTSSWQRMVFTFTPASALIWIDLQLDVTGITEVWGAQLEKRSTVTAYTPTTTAPITNYIPVLLTAAAGVPRFEHNPVTGESLGLEIEEQRTNLFTYSEQFDNAVWVKSNATVAANTVVAPDGTVTADKIIPDSGAVGSFYRPTGISSSQTVTLSLYAKAAEWRYVRLQFGASFSPQPAAWFDLQAGVIVSQGGTGAQISSVGNGWFRISVTSTWLSATDNSLYVNLSNLPSSYTSGDGTSGVFLWGAQLEVGPQATSYIPTVASQVTRAADSASMTGANFSSWYNQAEGTLYAECVAPAWTSGPGSAPGAVSINDGSANNRMYFGRSVSTTRPFFNASTGGVSQADITTSTSSWLANTAMKLAGAYKFNDFALSTQGSAVGTDVVAIVPVVTQMQIGNRSDGNIWNAAISRIAYYPKRLTNAELQAITI